MTDKHERTIVLIKPDAIQRSLVANIIHRFELKGLKIVGIKMISVDDATVREHYAHHVDKPFFDSLKRFMQSAPIVVLALEGFEAVKVVRQLAGATSGREADIGTIRGDLSMSLQMNVVHASENVEAAQEELKRFFDSKELFAYDKIDFETLYSESER
ncbi:MAG: nucleoside-diphosphate kinase [Patescibacteria group bacterium]|jgi:nucleoside-diphosphate kinase